MAVESCANELVESVKGLFGIVRGELVGVKGELAAVKWELAAVREELFWQCDRALELEAENKVIGVEVADLREALGVLQKTNEATRAVVEERGSELAALRGELADHKRQNEALRAQLDATKKGLEEAERRREADVRQLRADMREGEHGVKGVVVKEREERMKEEQGWRQKLVRFLTRQGAKEELDRKEERQRMLDVRVTLLEELQTCGPDVKKAWQIIKSASQETSLDLSDVSCLSDATLNYMSTMTHLQSVSLGGLSGCTAISIKHLYRLPRLKKLTLSDNIVDIDHALDGIGVMSSLQTLSLLRSNVTDTGLLHLTGVSSLQTLSLPFCSAVTSAGMMHVCKLTGLERLILYGTQVKEDGLQRLTSLTKLKLLWSPEYKNGPRASLNYEGLCSFIGRAGGLAGRQKG